MKRLQLTAATMILTLILSSSALAGNIGAGKAQQEPSVRGNIGAGLLSSIETLAGNIGAGFKGDIGAAVGAVLGGTTIP
jgi:hypothetical protein